MKYTTLLERPAYHPVFSRLFAEKKILFAQLVKHFSFPPAVSEHVLDIL